VASAFAAHHAAAQQQQPQKEPRVFSETAARGNGIGVHMPDLDVALYGLLDITLSTVDNKNVPGDRLTNFQAPWFSGPRWGVIGRRTLPDGAPNLIFKLEGEFLLDTGRLDTDNTIFNRDAWVGFQSDGLGKLTFGRQNTLARDFSGNYGDPYTPDGRVTLDERGWTNTNNFKQLIFYAASPTGTRYDRGVVWKKQFGDLVGGLGYQFQSPPPSGKDPVAGQNGHNTTQSAALAWNGGGFNVSGFINRSDVNTFTHKSFSLGGNVGVGPMVRVHGGFFHYAAEQPVVGQRKDDAWTISGRFAPPGKLDYELGYARFKGQNAGLSGSGFIRNPYSDTSSVVASGSGTKGTIYTSVFYHFDRSTEVYVAADWMKTNSGWADPRSFGHDKQTELAVGLRTRF
jgi:predicted porin